MDNSFSSLSPKFFTILLANHKEQMILLNTQTSYSERTEANKILLEQHHYSSNTKSTGAAVEEGQNMYK